MANSNLHAAKVAKNDEFYTQLTDIEKEVKHYKSQFKDKVVLCNCDDPEESNFWVFFSKQFDNYGLKGLISTHYDDSKPSYMLEMKRMEDGTVVTEKTPLMQNGDFRSPECVALLDRADIVVTNPPFSLFREYVAQLVEHNKKFLVLGNTNAVTYKEIFPLIKDGKMWPGYSFNKTMDFEMPDNYELKGKAYVDANGKKHGFVPAITWFTNLDTAKRHEKLLLWKTYNDEEFPHYDNYDAIEVAKTADIPADYDGVMGVPITFLDKCCPEQFEIVGLAAGNIRGLAGIPTKTGKDGPYINGVLKYGRILIRRKQNS